MILDFIRNRRIMRMSGLEYAAHLKENRVLFSQGEHCYVDPSAVIADPDLTCIGSNVRISANVKIFGHDGSVNMINRAYGTKLDAVGPVRIGNNVFIGDGVRIGRNVSIGNNVIIGMGAVVTGDIPDGGIWGGVPARHIGETAHYRDKLAWETRECPWADIIAARPAHWAPEIENTITVMRQVYFFGAKA